jgi:hypothetical protein
VCGYFDFEELVIDESEYKALMEWYWWGKTKVLREKMVPVPFCPPQISHERALDCTWDPTMKHWQLTISGMPQSMCFLSLTIVHYDYKSLNTTVIILCFKMNIGITA